MGKFPFYILSRPRLPNSLGNLFWALAVSAFFLLKHSSNFRILVEVVMAINPTLKVLVGIIYNLSEILYPMFLLKFKENLAGMTNTFY